MKIYTGTTFTRYEEARAVNDRLRALGHEITHDWTRTDEFGDDGHPLKQDPSEISKDDARRYAADDIAGVLAADACLFLGEQASLGWPVEFGLALGSSRCHSILVVQPFRWTVFLEVGKVDVVPDLATAMRVFEGLSPARLRSVA